MKLGDCGNGATRKRRRQPCEIGQESEECRAGGRSVTLHQGRKKVQWNHGENKKSEEKFSCTAPGEQALQPRTDEPLERHVEQHEERNDQQHGRQHARLGDGSTGGHGKQPANRCERREIGEPIRQPDDVEGAEAQREPKQGAELEIRPEAGDKNREYLPEEKNSPEKECYPL